MKVDKITVLLCTIFLGILLQEVIYFFLEKRKSNDGTK